MIEIHRQSKYGEKMQDIIFQDVDGGMLIGENGLYQIPTDSSYWNYRVVMTNNDGDIEGWLLCGDHDAIQRSVVIQELYILKNHRKKGKGKELINSALEYYKRLRMETIKIKVFTHNKGAIKLYESMGFKKMGEEKECCSIGDMYFYSMKLEKNEN